MRLALLLALALPLAACDAVGGSDDLSDEDRTAIETAFSCADVEAAPVGGSRSGTLGADDCRAAGSTFLADHYAFRLDAAATLTFVIDAPDFTPLVALRTAQNGRIASSSAEGTTEGTADGFRVTLTQTLTPGLYVVAATTVVNGAGGAYTLRIDD